MFISGHSFSTIYFGRLKGYGKCRKGVASLDLQKTRNLTAWEQQLGECQEVVEIRGKVWNLYI